MNQIMVTDSGSPLIERIAFLESYIVDRQRYEFFFGHFVGIFIILIHKKIPPCSKMKIMTIVNIYS